MRAERAKRAENLFPAGPMLAMVMDKWIMAQSMQFHMRHSSHDSRHNINWPAEDTLKFGGIKAKVEYKTSGECAVDYDPNGSIGGKLEITCGKNADNLLINETFDITIRVMEDGPRVTANASLTLEIDAKLPETVFATIDGQKLGEVIDCATPLLQPIAEHNIFLVRKSPQNKDRLIFEINVLEWRQRIIDAHLAFEQQRQERLHAVAA